MTKTRKSMFAVFSSSFMKGMAAPAFMHDEHTFPEMEKLIETRIDSHSIGQSLRRDWVNIGVDLQTSLGKHGQKKSKATTAKSSNY